MEKLSRLIQSRFEEMCQTGRLYRADIDGELLFETYMRGFGEDPIFRSTESSVHNCNYCHGFIKRYGNIVALDNNLEIMTLFDVEADEEYKESMRLMSELVKKAKIKDIFVETYSFLANPKTPYEPGCRSSQLKYRLGVAVNTKRYTKEDVSRWPNSGIKVNDVIDFHHMFITVPKEFIDFSGRSVEELMAGPRQWRDVFKRALNEITLDTFILVRDLEAQAEKLQKLEKPGDDLSFLEEVVTPTETKEIEIEKLRFEILKDVFITRRDEAKDAAADVKKKEELSHLREILRDKKEEELKKLSAEELEKRIKELEEGK